ncbi:hypothetical protein [Porphyromonas sp.]|uniref:methyltransferase RsmF C-terminal domain-like protein n=1 Tax=Porphyromonas sp. TaxID=1924944 RepID=UPI0026DBB97D|nr:hypothetical protein [Porphyromonas sp.]MDO4695274.1 hypothetical protein [Porphyromonas sp.]MDO4770688.1 hypothetical protein [Porphyromonas sp.]
MAIEQRFDLPSSFLEAFESSFGKEETEALCHSMEEPSPTSIRINPKKISLSPQSAKRVPWSDLGYYIDSRPTFGVDPLWHAGAYYVQEASSMFVSCYLTNLDFSPKVALDLCAAPGGKSTLMRSLLPQSCVLITNEPDKGRATILHENITRYGGDEIIITNAYPHQLRASGLKCDLILVDAPCSGEGMFRKDPNSRNEWSLGSVASCSAKQKDIIDEAWQMLQPGGILIYSTCTYNREENEAQLSYILDNFDVDKILSPNIQDTESLGIQRGSIDGVYRFFPHHAKGEGLAIFAVQKSGEKTEAPDIKQTKKGAKDVSLPPVLKENIQSLDRILIEGDQYSYLSPRAKEIVEYLNKSKVKILSKGIILGNIKGKDFIPHHSWAMSTQIFDKAPYPKVEVDEETAMTYLKREAINPDPYKGFQSVIYKGVPLGWVKNIGNRVNNLYPKELVIRNRNAEVTDIPKLF